MPEAHRRSSARTGENPAVADIECYGIALTERLLDDIDPIFGGFKSAATRSADVAAHLLLWGRYMATGKPCFGGAVLRSLRAICRSTPHLEMNLSDSAQLLELLTWVWRVERCPALHRCAEEIVACAVSEMRVPGFGFAAGVREGERDTRILADRNGLMLVALVEAGSVFERRDWLALAREVFDELAASLRDADALWDNAANGCRGPPARLEDYATMSRAAIRLFEAFGKRRYLEQAEAWVARLDARFAHVGGGYHAGPAETRSATSAEPSITNAALPSGNALMIGVFARLHALSGRQRYAQRAECLAEAFHHVITRSGIVCATAVANVRTAAELVSIEISGDPKLAQTRELMRIALDCGLPDRLVLGPGAGGLAGESPLARIAIGTRRLVPVDDAARLRATLAPGGLALAFLGPDACETVDSRTQRSIT